MRAKYARNAFVALALPQTPLGELSALPRTLAGFKVATSKGRAGEGRREGKGGRRKEGAGGEKGEGAYRYFFFPTSSTAVKCMILEILLLEQVI